MASIAQTPAYSVTYIRSEAQPNMARRIIHLRYPEAPFESLVAVDNWGKQRLLPQAATAYQSMQKAAEFEGIHFAPISSYRDNRTQHDIFFREAKQRNQTLAERSKVSAPPGYSEHSTGYVVDLVDTSPPDSSRAGLCFEETPAYRWLLANSKKYGYELSFPPNNWQGVNFEPWHFRYVGDDRSQKVFERARKGRLDLVG